MNGRLGTFVAVFCGIVLALGVIVSFAVEDNTIRALVALLAALYVIYLIRLSKKRQTDRDQDSGEHSPLRKR